MCRISGIIDKNKSPQQLATAVEAMCAVMAHGGPDGEGFYSDDSNGLHFGHRRLALIDLSPKGDQPMFYNDSKLVITFNGEIYNYLELKRELKNSGFSFHTDSDTEVILAAYQAWGIESFDKLKGMFAFAIYDITKQKTFLVRDETGIKPLYYSVSGEKLVFASEVKAFESLNYSYSENPDWKIYFLAFGHLPEPYTTYSEIVMLPKANYLTWNHADSSFAINCFKTEATELKARSENGVENEVRHSLKRSVERHLLSDAPIGIFLSGGVDSSIISLLAEEIRIEKNQKTKVNTLAINFKETAFSEHKYQEIISAKINSEHSSHTITNTFFHKHLPSALNAMDQPSTDGLNSWFVNYFAKKKGLKAVLSGIGADELFGGYPSFNRMKTVTRLMLLPAFILKKGKFFKKSFLKRAYYLSYKNTVGQYLFLRGICSPDEIAELLDVEIDYVDSVLSGINISAPKHLQSKDLAGWMEFNMYMQNQLLKDTDTMSMHHGVEVRIPFLDKDFTRLIQSLPSELKFSGHIKKWFLIKSFIKTLPKAIWNRPKMGFTFPFQLWLQNENCLSNVENQKASKFLSSFQTGKLHWSKALAIYIVFK